MHFTTRFWYALILLVGFHFPRLKCGGSVDNLEEVSFGKEETDLVSHSVLNTLPRYVLYDVNRPEGFNLRRDVFIRMASFIHHLNKVSDYYWILVLPPWHRLYHWRSSYLVQDRLPWSLFFDVDSIKETTPVVELHEFFQMNGLRPLDAQITLQDFHMKSFEQYPDFSDKWEVANCKVNIQTEFWNLNNLTFTKSLCISFLGVSSLLADIVKELEPRTIIFDHAEIALHNYYGGQEYWAIRKSMQFNDSLQKIAQVFQKTKLKHGYMCVHLRRRDFLYGHPSDVPSIKGASKQIMEKMNLLNKIETVYVATDAPRIEFEELCDYLQPYKVLKFEADEKILNTYMDGGIAIIDQIICSQANYFVGTSKSTFSFRIQEEREILGLPPETTFNSFCGDTIKQCEQPTKWRLVS